MRKLDKDRNVKEMNRNGIFIIDGGGGNLDLEKSEGDIPYFFLKIREK